MTPRGRSLLATAGVVALSTVLATAFTGSLRRDGSRERLDPDRFAHIVSGRLARRLELSQSQREAMFAHAREYRVKANAIERRKIQSWRALAGVLDHATPAEVEERMREIADITREREAAHLAMLTRMAALLPPAQGVDFYRLFQERCDELLAGPFAPSTLPTIDGGES